MESYAGLKLLLTFAGGDEPVWVCATCRVDDGQEHRAPSRLRLHHVRRHRLSG